LLFVPSNLPILQTCTKSGSWIKSKFPLMRSYLWTSRPRPYFPNFPDLSKTLTVTTDLIDSVELIKIFDCYVSRDPGRSHSLNIYQSKISSSGLGQKITDAILLDISGGESFQHFVQDSLPILSLVKGLPSELENIPILLSKPADSFKSAQLYFDCINLKNPIKFIEPHLTYFVNNLYLFDFKPINMMYGLPASLYSRGYKLIQSTLGPTPNRRSALLVERREKSRNFKDFNLISAQIEDWAESRGLIFETLNTGTSNIEEIRSCFRRAKYIFAIHGGANYNVIWSQPDVTLIEFIPSRATDSVLPLALGFGLRYLPFALNHDKGEKEFEISSTDLDSIFNTLQLNNL